MTFVRTTKLLLAKLWNCINSLMQSFCSSDVCFFVVEQCSLNPLLNSVHENVTSSEIDPALVSKRLPWRCTLIGWLFIILGVAYGSVFTVFFGMMYGLHASRQWYDMVFSCGRSVHGN